MIAAVAQPEQQALRSADPQHRSLLQAPDGIQPRPAAAPEQSQLQAIHAGKHGVILKGLRHETFWEW